MQARKSDEDVQKICDMCDELKVSQLIKILNLYTPADEFEERVSPSFVRKIQNKLQSRALAENEQQVSVNRIFRLALSPALLIYSRYSTMANIFLNI